MNFRQKQFGKVDVSKLLRISPGQLTLLPCCMITAVVLNRSISFTAVGWNLLSYLALALSLLSFALMFFLYIRRGVISRIVSMVIIFAMLLMSSTIINGNDVKTCFYDSCSLIFIAMACDYYKDRFSMLIVAFAIAFSFCAYLNFLHMLSHPELWIIENLKNSQGYLLGSNYNQMGCRLLCAIGTSIACLKYSKWWLINIIPVALVSIATLVIVGSMTSLTGLLLFLVISLIPSQKLIKSGIVCLLFGVILFQVFVCFQGKGIEQNPLAVYFVEDVLGKDITFTYRTYMWDAAAKVFVDSPFYGYGYVNNDWYISHMSSIAMGTHNYIWGVLVSGGIFLLTIFSYICFLSFSKFFAATDRFVILIYATATILFLMMLMENFPHLFIFTLLLLSAFAPQTNKI